MSKKLLSFPLPKSDLALPARTSTAKGDGLTLDTTVTVGNERHITERGRPKLVPTVKVGRRNMDTDSEGRQKKYGRRL